MAGPYRATFARPHPLDAVMTRAIFEAGTEGRATSVWNGVGWSTYVPPPSIVCPRCSARSFSAGDIEHRYCGRGHQFHEDVADVAREIVALCESMRRGTS